MKKYFAFLAILIGAFVPHFVFAAETIDSFTVQATLNSERHLTITETITYDFGDEPRHGIFRNIPETYVRNGATYKYRLENVYVTMDGENTPYDITRPGGSINIKIGDPEMTITGPHVYEITYETDRAINFLEDHSELYWNVTGNEWEVPIAKSDFTLTFPKSPSSPQTACFTGPVGSTEADCDVQTNDASVAFASTRLLNPYEGLTVVIGFPPGLIREPTLLEKFLVILRDNGILAVPLIALLLMWRLWWAKGRDPEPSTVIPIYESPEKLSPAELEAVREDGALSGHGITATIIDLARRGYLHIRYGEEKGLIVKKQEFTLVKVKDADTGLSDAERILFEGLFEDGSTVELEDLQKNKFYLSVHKAKEAVWKSLESKQIFDKRPATVRAMYLAFGFGIAWAMLFFVGFLPLAWFAAILTGIIIAGFGWFMPRRTTKGAKLLANVKGFEWFMSVTEKDRLAFHNAPARTPTEFQALLPFAIALGVEQAWAKQFEGIDMRPPDWAEGSIPAHWSALHFVSSISSLHTQASASGYSAPSSAGSGGSGFSGGGSGGGGGGGGGGSW